EIRVYADKPEEAQRIANKIAQTYREHRLEQTRDQIKNGIKTLEEQSKLQEAVLAKAQKDVDDLRTKLQINDPDPASFYPTPTLSADALRQLTTMLIQLDVEQARVESQLTNLLTLSPQKLRDAIQTSLPLPDAELTSLLNSYDQAEQKLISMQRDYTPEN